MQSAGYTDFFQAEFMGKARDCCLGEIEQDSKKAPAVSVKPQLLPRTQSLINSVSSSYRNAVMSNSVAFEFAVLPIVYPSPEFEDVPKILAHAHARFALHTGPE
jgi:hypothetical protein